MNLADEVRDFCFRTYIQPANKKNIKEIEILLGDVHKSLNYKRRHPLVCAALGTNIFEDKYGLSRISIEGPLNSAKTLFKFKINKKAV
jgi:hypothetical protein